MNIIIKKLSSEDFEKFKVLINLFEDVFEMENFKMPADSHLQKVLSKDNFIVFAAEADGKIVGGLTAYILEQYYAAIPLVYIYDLAVNRTFQRQGIGKMILAELKLYCKGIGVKEVFVQADIADKHAIEFYRTTGGIAEDVIHFDYLLE